MRTVIRADASPTVGMGHVTRCLALAQQLRASGISVEFVCRDSEGSMLSEMETSHGFRINRLPADVADWREDLRGTLALTCRETRPDWIVVDHYQLDARWENGAREKCGRLLAIDDIADRDHESDLLLDQNLHASPEVRYRKRVPPACRMLLGPKFALLRPMFADWQGWQRHIPPLATRVLVTLGGGDVENMAATVLGGLTRIADFPLEIHALVGGGPSSPTQLQALAEQLGGGRHRIVLERRSYRMPELMAWASLAVTGGGSTAWELAFMGLPSLMITLSDDQRPNVAALAAAGLSVDLGDFGCLNAAQIAAEGAKLAADSKRRADMSRNLRKLVDGRGAERVVAAMRESIQ